MTLDQLLKLHGIHRPADLVAILGVNRQYAWQLWHGRRKFTPEQALKLLDARGVPMDQLYRSAFERSAVPKGRPRKRKDDQHADPDDPEVQP
jgi:transcriptional regulator with XRE-family HTH domain